MSRPNRNIPLPPAYDRQPHRRRKFVRAAVNLLAWLGIAVLYYIGFSFFFDTPVEYRMKEKTRRLEQEYAHLSARYDSLQLVLQNVADRDRSVFGTLFESEPYDLEEDRSTERWRTYEALQNKTNAELGDLFDRRVTELERKTRRAETAYEQLYDRIETMQQQSDRIPSIQPVINPDLTLLTASYGMRIHPFYKSLASHQGVDYTVPTGSRVFATADGTVKEIMRRSTASGLTVVLDHGNGYETSYSHLSSTPLRRGQKVRRGEIIARSGNSGLSLSPHLHYEVRHNGMRVDPIHYFFMELSPDDYQRMIRIARSGMQSFD